MRVSFNWLKDFVDIKISPQELAETLTLAGLEATSITRYSHDFVLEFEVTSNRVDWLSIHGICQDISALLKEPLKKLSPPPYRKEKKDFKIITDSALCPLYVARILEGVRVEESPPWIKERLRVCGLSSVNNVVDITNYVLLELGQPLHAFDLDKLSPPLYVRKAHGGEKILALNGKEYQLSEEVVVIADRVRPVAIAGIMGSLDTQVDNSTQRILLESALFNPVLVRRTSRYLGLATESSYRFERGLNPYLVELASRRCVFLMEELKIAKFSGFKEERRIRPKRKKINLDMERLNQILDTDLKFRDVKEILENLGFRVRKEKAKIFILPPLTRKDINLEEDVVEEVARIYGYENIKEKIPPVFVDIQEKDIFAFKSFLRSLLVLRGFYEIVTFSLCDAELLRELDRLKESLGLLNPLTSNYSHLRPTLIAGMLEVFLFNSKQKQHSFRFFEIANTYFAQGKNFQERPRLGIIISGKKSFYWQRQKDFFDFFDLKGIVVYLCKKLGIKDFSFSQDSDIPFLDYSLNIKFKDKDLGFLGKIKKQILSRRGLSLDTFYAEMDIINLFICCRDKRIFVPFSRYPQSLRDISFFVEENVVFSEVIDTILACPVGYLKDIILLDVYKDEKYPGKKSFLLRLIYQESNRTLTSEEVEKATSLIKNILEEKLKAIIR